MVIEVDRLIERYPLDSVVYGVAADNPVLYRFVLPKPYFGSPSGDITSQMPGENPVDGYDLRNQAVLDRIALERELKSKRRPASK